MLLWCLRPILGPLLNTDRLFYRPSTLSSDSSTGTVLLSIDFSCVFPRKDKPRLVKSYFHTSVIVVIPFKASSELCINRKSAQ